MPGIVYVLSNPAMPGLVKIGFTEQDGYDERVMNLYTTGVPLPFVCELAWRVANPRQCESMLHNEFSEYRVNNDREFFRVSPQEVRSVLEAFDGEEVFYPDGETAGQSVQSLQRRRGLRDWQGKPRLRFDTLGVSVGTALTDVRSGSVAHVASGTLVSFGGQRMTLKTASRLLYPSLRDRPYGHWSYWETPDRNLIEFVLTAYVNAFASRDAREFMGDAQFPTLKENETIYDLHVLGFAKGTKVISRTTGKTATIVNGHKIRLSKQELSLWEATRAVLNKSYPIPPLEEWMFRRKSLAELLMEEYGEHMTLLLPSSHKMLSSGALVAGLGSLLEPVVVPNTRSVGNTVNRHGLDI